ncbi:hypothetical protein EJB05_22902, partial [Eragrostis curvula]
MMLCCSLHSLLSRLLVLMSIVLTHACARLNQHFADGPSRISALEASLAAKEESLKASSSTVSLLERETEKTLRDKKVMLEKENLFHTFLSSRLSDLAQSKASFLDSSFAESLRLCDLLKELFQAVGAKYDKLSQDASPDSVKEWLYVNVRGLVEVCRSYSYDAVILMIRDVLHSFVYGGSDATDRITNLGFSMKPSHPDHDFGIVEARSALGRLAYSGCSLLLLDMESLWDRLPRGVVKELVCGRFKRGDVLPQELVDHFAELDRLAEMHSLIEVPAEPVPLAIVPPGVIIISDDEGPEDRPPRPSQYSGVASLGDPFPSFLFKMSGSRRSSEEQAKKKLKTHKTSSKDCSDKAISEANATALGAAVPSANQPKTSHSAQSSFAFKPPVIRSALDLFSIPEDGGSNSSGSKAQSVPKKVISKGSSFVAKDISASTVDVRDASAAEKAKIQDKASKGVDSVFAKSGSKGCHYRSTVVAARFLFDLDKPVEAVFVRVRH